MRFEIGSGVACDLDTLRESRLLVNAQSGGGKTTLLRRILEETHGRIQQLVLDPEGEFYTLREHFDYIIAGKGGDCAAEPRSAKLLARRLLELGVSAVCDLSELKAHDRITFVRYFLEALVDAPRELRHPILVVLDEAHVFAPEKGQAESAPAVIDICARGRKRGLCALLATQRLSKLHKDAAAELRNVLIGATGLDIDQVRAGDVLGFQKAERIALRDLKWGEFYAYGPALSPGVVRLKAGPTQTFNPPIGVKAEEAPAAPTEKIRSLLAKVTDLPAEAEAERKSVDDLKRDLANTKRELTLARKGGGPPDQEVIDRQILQAVGVATRGAANEVRDLQADMTKVKRGIGEAVGYLDKGIERLRVIQTNGGDRTHGVHVVEPKRETPGPPPQPKREPTPPRERAEPSGDLTGPEQRVLDALAWWEAIGVDAPTKGQVGYIARYRVGKSVGGTFGNLLGTLRSRGLLDYPGAGTASLTDEGRALARVPDDHPTRDALHEMIYARLTGPEERVLKVIAFEHPDALSKQEAGERGGYQVGPNVGGTFGNILGSLRSLGLIDYPTPGRVVATDLLFPEGL